jgi:hypothetical protein
MYTDDVLMLPDFAAEGDISAIDSAFDAAVAFGGSFVHSQPLRTQVVCRNIGAACDPEVFERVVDTRNRIVATMRQGFSAATFPDLTLLSEMRIGDSHPLHADAEQETADGWKPNHAFWLTHAGLLYLNTCGIDYEGGLLELPTVGRTIAPARGMLVAFPSGRRHVHRVSEVTAGVRRTLTVWLTMDPARGEPFGGTLPRLAQGAA